jgi:hypothetical protein
MWYVRNALLAVETNKDAATQQLLQEVLQATVAEA